jgi:membrane-associated phospholipid phosphatase
MRILLSCVLAAALAACTQSPTRTEATPQSTVRSPWAAPTSTVRWNEYACELIARNKVGQFPALRTLAYLNLAINNAVVGARANGVKPEGAAAGAAATILTYLYPTDEQALAGRLATETAALGANGGYRQDFAAGVAIGRATGDEVVAMARADRSGSQWTGTVPTGGDKWSSRAQPSAPPLGPQFGSMRTFFMTAGSDFRAPPPPAIGSPEFKATLTEVRTISDNRTYEQLRIAQYWEGLSGAFSAGGWNEVARRAISQRGLGEAESARILALVHMAAWDAQAACHDSKYVYWVPRPTQLDPDIRLAIGVPNHPSYPSNHACISGTIGTVLDAQFPEERGRYVEMGNQAGESRIYAGIHYRVDVDAGNAIARKVAARAIAVGVPADRPFTPRGQ